jgi:zinc protease
MRQNALAIASRAEPLVIGRVASGTEVALDQCQEGVWYCELEKNRMVKKEKGGIPVESEGPDDTTRVLVETLNNYQAQLFVTSGHATERDWQIGFRYKNGYFKSKQGQLFGLDTNGQKFVVDSPNPKVYMPVGNCLMGHIDGPDAMALAWLKSAGVHQMLGYTVPTWYGYAGWGCLDYFVEQPGRYSFAEAYLANQHAMIHRLETCFPEVAREALGGPQEAMKLRSKVVGTTAAKSLGLGAQDGVGLVFDRDAVALYGDPAWDARLAPGKLAYEQSLTEKDGVWTFEVTPKIGARSFAPVNENGAQRGWRPMVAFFPQRLVGDIEILEGKELGAVVADDFVLLPNPRVVEGGKRYRVTFRVE